MKYFCSTLVVLLALTAQPFAQTAAKPAVLGEWDITTVSPIGENTNTMEISKDGEALKAVAKGPQGERPYDSISMTDAAITIVMTVDFQGQAMIITYQGTVDGDVMNGAADFGGLAQGSWSAKRKPAPEK
jgi:hypothetical protein